MSDLGWWIVAGVLFAVPIVMVVFAFVVSFREGPLGRYR